MLTAVDRMQLAVADGQVAADTFVRKLGGRIVRKTFSPYLNAQRTIVAVGESEFELCEPAGTGRARTHLDQWGEGLLAAGLSTQDLAALTARFDAREVPYERDGAQVVLSASTTAGLNLVISQHEARPRVGPVSFLYEATNTLQTDWQQVASRYADLFGLDASRFCPISNSRFGYAGTLTLFDPPARLDRLELSQTFADQPGAMRRFVEKRGGDGLYMCFVEAHDFDGLKRRLLDAGATLTARSRDVAAERDTVWVHPKDLHGMLLGISRTGFAWEWSGRPELVPVL